MKPQLSAFDLEADAETLYRRVLRAAPGGLDGHAAELGWSHTRASRHLHALVGLRLVRVRGDGTVQADDPRAALERLIDHEQARLDSRRQQLSQTRRVIAQFAADHRIGQQTPSRRQPAWETVSAEAAASVVEHLARTTGGSIRQVNLTVEADPAAHGDSARAVEDTLNRGRSQYTIYPLSAVTDHRWRHWMHRWKAMGEVQRVLEAPPTEFALFGTEAVLAADVWGEAGADYVVIREPMLVAAFSTLFEELWRRSQTVHDGAAREANRRILELLALGFKDEAIARYLGLGLRTVRRHIASLIAEMGVDTRFQLGMAAQRRGLLP